MARMDLPWAECDNIGDILHVLHDGMDEIAMSRDASPGIGLNRQRARIPWSAL